MVEVCAMLSALVLTCTYFVFKFIASSSGVKIHIDAEDFMGDVNGTFFRYAGSLTIPGCYESVTWTVFEDKLDIKQDEVWFDTNTYGLHYIT